MPFPEKYRLGFSLTLLAFFISCCLFSPRPKTESSLYRLLDEPLASARSFRAYLDEFPSDQNKLAAVIQLGGSDTLDSLQGALAHTTREVKEIWEQQSVFDLRYLDYDPKGTRVFFPTFEQSGAEREKRIARHPMARLFYNAGKRMAYVEWTIRKEGERSPAETKALLRRIESALREKLAPGAEAYFGGPFFLEYHFQRGLQQNMQLGIFSAVTLAVALFFLFPRLAWVLAVLATTLLTQQLIAAGMGLAGQKFSPLTSCLYLMMTVAIVEDYVFLFYVVTKYDLEFLSAAKRLRWASFFTSLTSAVGFGSLLVTRSPKVQEFGLWAAVGTSLEWVIALWIFPPILQLVSPKNNARPGALLARIERAASIPIRWANTGSRRAKTLIRCAILGSFPLIAWACTHADVSYDFFETFSPKHPVGIFWSKLEEMSGYATEMNVFFPQRLPARELRGLQEKIEKNRLGHAIGFRDFIPAEAAKLPESYQLMIEHSLEHSSQASTYVNPGTERLKILLPKADSAYLATVQRRISEICRGRCFPAGEVLVLNDLSVSFLEQLYRSLGLSLLIVAAVLFLLAWRFARANIFAVIVSSMWGPLAFLSVVVLLGIRVNVAICVCIAVFVGLAGDSAIQFLLFRKEGDSLTDSVAKLGPASGVIFLLMSLSCLSFSFSNFAVTQRLAWLFPLGFLVLFVGDLLVLQIFARAPCGDQDEVSRALSAE